MVQTKRSSKRLTFSDTSLLEIRKISNKTDPTVHLKKLENNQQNPKLTGGKNSRKIKAEKNEAETKNNRKDQQN